jgi:hypothetical protein
MVNKVTTGDCRTAIVEWLKEKSASAEWSNAGMGAYLVEENWKRRTKTMPDSGEVFRSFTAGSVNAEGQVASLEVVESVTGYLTVRVDAANQPREFLHMLAIKSTVDRGETWGSW